MLSKASWTIVVWEVHNDIFWHVSIVGRLALGVCNFDDCASGTIEQTPSWIEVLAAQRYFGPNTQERDLWNTIVKVRINALATFMLCLCIIACDLGNRIG